LERYGLPWPLWFWQGWKNLSAAIRASDVLHVHDFIYPSHLVAIFLASRQGKPVLLTQHIGEIAYRNRALRWLLKAVNRTFGRWALASATQVVFISPRVKREFEKFVNFSRAPLYWANGVDDQAFFSIDEGARLGLRKRYDLKSEQPLILFVGRFVERKGLLLLERMARAKPEWQWCFAGWGALDPEAWGIPQVRVWHGLKGKELAGLYQMADLLILPSYGEGFPLVVQEALACGTPVLISEETAAGGPEIPGGITSVPLDPDKPDVAAWLAAIDRLLVSDGANLWRRTAAVGRYSWGWDSLAVQYGNMLKSLVK
jgi:glycosyltransferase involved in cell wall biosynthesis